MDTGIDYNHPYLIENIHFTLDSRLEPVSAGWDYLGNDSWPAPYIGRTDFFNENLSAKERSDSFKMFNASKLLISENPELKKYFPIERNIEEEQAEAFDHGTHVAGLASYDSPEIGLLGYRVIPLNKLPAGQKDADSVFKRFSDVLISSLDRAILDGARVINMSLGLGSNKDAKDLDKTFFKDFQQRLINVAESNPEVLFIVAAGNDGKWIDGSSVSGLPCFVPRKNVICVSALSEDMTPTTFTNIVLSNEVTTIYAWGEKILSAFPSNSCHSSKLKFESIEGSKQVRDEFAKIASEECVKNMKLKEASGTSMAAPIIARKVAKIIAEDTSRSAEEVKKLLFNKANHSKIGALNVFTLPIDKPSWYGTNTNLKGKKINTAQNNFNFMFLSK